MGITGLLPSVKSQITNSHVKDFKGRRVAVDGYAWLHKAAYSCARELCRGEHTDKWVYYILGQIDMFTFHDVHVVRRHWGARI
jgi:exonuclease-1